MRMIDMRIVGLTGALAITLAMTATAANALPDLVINTKDSYVLPGGCAIDEPIATGRIAIKNQGEDIAQVNVAERLTRSMLVVYVPENIDMIDKRPERQKLEPFDQQGIAFRLGEGKVKRGRNFNPIDVSHSPDAGNDAVSKRERIRAIQTALLEVGFDPQGIDAQLGRRTLAAIREFQASLGEQSTGKLTSKQETQLYQKAGFTTGPANGARGETKVRVFASVDPYNLVEESNEANNSWSFFVTVDCK